MTPHAAIIAHGQPGDPAPLQREIAALAARVADLLPGWRVDGATLADAASLPPLAGVELVYPLFMAGGWFVGQEMPRKLTAAGVTGYRVLPPFGRDPALPALGLDVALSAAAAAGLDPRATTLVVAGHGSQKSRASANSTRDFAATLAQAGRFAAVEVGFIEETPFLSDLRPAAPALCLPFFATNASHTCEDIPEAWSAAGDPGPIAPALGTVAAIPALIAAALREAVAVPAG